MERRMFLRMMPIPLNFTSVSSSFHPWLLHMVSKILSNILWTLLTRHVAPDAGIDSCTLNKTNPLYPSCANTTYAYAASSGGWNIGAAADPLSPWLHKATDWVPAFLHYIQDTWKPSGGVAVTEFGFAEPFEVQKTLKADILFDPIRSSYYKDYMEAILMAISEGVNVVGCLAWSILDNLEWNSGYQDKFGMQ